jgi:uncharacterized protein YjbI with pentapeptide repeats
LTGAILTGVTLELADTRGADLTGVLRSPGDEALARAGILAEKALDANAWTESGGVFGEPAVFDGEDLRPLGDRLKDLKLPGLSARHACFAGMDLKGASLQGAGLEGADLRGCDLRGADLRGVRLNGALLNRADLRGANLGALAISKDRFMPAKLVEAILRFARLEGATLDAARLDGADVSGARIDPESLTAEQRQVIRIPDDMAA